MKFDMTPSEVDIINHAYHDFGEYCGQYGCDECPIAKLKIPLTCGDIYFYNAIKNYLIETGDTKKDGSR